MIVCTNTNLSSLDLSQINNLDYLVATENDALNCIKINQQQENDIYYGELEVEKDESTEISQNCD